MASRKAPEGSAGRLVQNTLTRGAGSFAGVAVTLFLTPLLIGELGLEGYGIWVLATTLTLSLGYLSLADFGVELSAAKMVAEARAARDPTALAQAISTAMAILVAAALVITPLVILLSGPLVGWLSVPAELQDAARLTFVLVACQFLFDLPARAFAALLQGTQEYVAWQAVDFIQVVLISAGLAGAVLLGYGIEGMAVATLSCSAVMLVVYALVSRRVVGAAGFSPRHVNRATARSLVSFGGQLMLFRICGLMYRQTDKIILAIMLTPAAVSIFEIAFKLQASAAMIEGIAISALFPAAAFSQADPAKLRDMLLRGTTYTMAVVTPVLVAAFVFAGPVIRTWIGEGYDEATTPAQLFICVLFLSVLVSVGQNILTGVGKVKGLLILSLVWIAANVPLTLLLVSPFGVSGAVLGTLIAQSLVVVPMARLILSELGVDAREWVSRVVVRMVPGVVIQGALAFLMLPLAEETDALIVVLLVGAVTVFVGLAVNVGIGLDGEYRRALGRVLRESLRRRHDAPETSETPELLGDVPGGTPPALNQVP